MKYALYGTIGLVIIFIVLNLLNYDGFNIIIVSFEWVTRYILPWIALYWFIQFVKRNKR
ncbi:hypothetical protein TMU01_26070 [Tenuibacillus multivorans]|uniref:Uncharacterized protein n=1 Tax=Tenuibacillus multivorans TaxID=237069 RepID=A0A1H0A246_9BACI|nr:hypothetical protein TMU01_26070 [Tenuibacillus multivorans]SDN27872.1 hypothetical protein SAMN05216498_1936 [Tenuibacillus multivorans]